ncbi:RNA polymerase sigma factor [Neorhodopirellula lusitana]|uniref:RNA polymerase sigma factor n=1 Tax=Neorhodopirellula lusitana TaxID=445327 RepID=UPI0038515DC2
MNQSQSLPTRASLLERVQSGPNHPDWDELLRYYEPFIRQFLGKIGVAPKDVDDICQQVLARLWKELSNYRRESEHARFRTWLSRLIRNVAINDYRKQKRADNLNEIASEQAESLLEKPSELELLIEHEWQQHVIGLALERLGQIFSGNALEVFLRSSEGESTEQISEALGISMQSVYVLKNRVKKRLTHEVKCVRQELEFPENES